MINARGFGSNLIKAISKGASMSFSQPYLGLFTTMPAPDLSGGVEVDYPEYTRVLINAKGIEGKDIMTSPYIEDGVDGDGDAYQIAKIKNQEIIYWPENQTGDAQTAVGWGLFDAKNEGSVYIAGKLAKEVEIRQNSVPIVRIDDFILGLK